jgi:hypothetical protein
MYVVGLEKLTCDRLQLTDDIDRGSYEMNDLAGNTVDI